MGTRRIKPLQEELTTSMHEEFIGDEIPHLDMMVMGVFGALRRGLSIDGALKLYGITKDEYDSNLERVLNS